MIEVRRIKLWTYLFRGGELDMIVEYHKNGDLDIHQFRGNMDITDWELLDSKPCRSEVANWT